MWEYRPYTEEHRHSAARKHGVSIEYVNDLMEALGGTGELTDPDIAVELWGDFSGFMDASWLVVDKGTLGNFSAWLIEQSQRSKRERTALMNELHKTRLTNAPWDGQIHYDHQE
jgi:hypothetical protein